MVLLRAIARIVRVTETGKKTFKGAGAIAGQYLYALLVACLLSAGSRSFADDLFGLTSGYVGNIDHAGNIRFSLTFNQPPDFTTVDSFDRQQNGFQFFIATSPVVPSDSPSRPYASLIRGNEIWVANDIRIRNDGPPDTDPISGGWGSVRGSVPYRLHGDTLTFFVPASVLNVSGRFGYSLLLTTYGAGNPTVYKGLSGGAIPVCVPEPSSLFLWVTGSLLMIWLPASKTRYGNDKNSARGFGMRFRPVETAFEPRESAQPRL